jgi:hypothetical protein
MLRRTIPIQIWVPAVISVECLVFFLALVIVVVTIAELLIR